MDYTKLIQLIISIGEMVVQEAQIKGAPEEIINELQSALDGYKAVHDSPVTFAQLESLRTKKTF